VTELQQRIATGLLAAPLFVGAVYLGGYAFGGAMVLIALAAQLEYYQLAAATDAAPLYPLGLALTAALALTVLHPPLWMLAGGLLVGGLAVSPLLCTAQDYVHRIAATLFGVVYPAGGLVALLFIRTHTAWPPESAILGTVWMIFAVWGTDIFAYFAGKHLGRRKLAPRISPNKTWAGALGGAGGALAAGGLYLTGGMAFSLPTVPVLHVVVLSTLIAIASVCGDLIQSLLKRSASAKDAGSLLPGHGGFFDRFDGMALAVPLAVVYLHLLLG